jgi:MFS family permease
MLNITLLLVTAQHATMAVAGFVLAGYTVGQASTAPLRGRLADRRGLFGVAAVCGGCNAVALLGLLGCSLARGPAWLLVGIATLAGLCNPPLSPGVRSLWSVHAGAGLRQAAFALDAVVFDLAFIVGPVVASALAAGVAPAVALGVLLVLTGAAVALVGAYRGSGVGPPTPHPAAGAASTAHPAAGAPPTPHPAGGAAEVRRTGRVGLPLRSAALRRLLLTAALANAALSATEVALTAYVRHHHALWASGPLLAEVSIGSIAGSLLLGTRPLAAAHRRLPRLLAGYTLGLTGLAAAGLYAPLLAVAAPVAGLCLGPTLATLFSGAAGAAPDGGGTEAQSWLNSIMNGGAAGGAAAAGLAAGTPVLGLALAAAIAGTGTVVALLTGRPLDRTPS